MSYSTNAGPSILGYQYQIEFALYLLLRSEAEEASVAIERLDDVVLNPDAPEQEFFQTKHHMVRSQATLTLLSEDLWKTLRNWIAIFKDGKVAPQARLVLVTTSRISETSPLIPFRSFDGRNNLALVKVLTDAISASETRDAVQLKAFSDFLSLKPLEQESLLNQVVIVDSALSIEDLASRITRLLRPRKGKEEATYLELLGWWYKVVKAHLLNESAEPILVSTLNEVLNDISDRLADDNLPINFLDYQPTQEELDPEQYQFVQQLQAIALGQTELNRAIIDYQKAFHQRGQWQRRKLLRIDELTQYEARLLDEWSRTRDEYLKDIENAASDEIAQVRLGQKVFYWSQKSEVPRIRARVAEPYVSRGSFHMLANEPHPRLLWHPRFVAQLQAIIDKDQLLQLSMPQDVSNLLNPAFCARILSRSIHGYRSEVGRGLPFGLSFFILPLALSQENRELLPKRASTKMQTWLRSNRELKAIFPEQVRSLVPTTRKGLVFGLNRSAFSIDEDAELEFGENPPKTPKKQVGEIREIDQKAELLGRWMANSGSVASIFAMWGIQP